MNVILYDNPETSAQFYPLTFTRSIADLRCGILTLKEKWQFLFNQKIFIQPVDYLQGLYTLPPSPFGLYIRTDVMPSPALVHAISELQANEALVIHDEVIAHCGSNVSFKGFKKVVKDFKITFIENLWDLLKMNERQIARDVERLKSYTKFQKNADPFTRIYNESEVYIEDGAEIRAAFINAENGPVYIGKNAFIHEGAVIKGPVAIGEGAIVMPGAQIRSACTIGPYSVVGGELKNVIIQGFTNKAHYGYLGDSYLGEWINLGAGASGSNLKNNYSGIRMWDYLSEEFEYSGEWKLGQVIGDFTHAGINTMFTSGTTVGIACNIIGGEFQKRFIKNFSWIDGRKYDFDKFIEAVEKQMELKNQKLTTELTDVLLYLHDEM